MTLPKLDIDPPRLALSRHKAAASLDIGPAHFREHVEPDLPKVYIGGKTLYSVDDLRAWVRKNRNVAGRAV